MTPEQINPWPSMSRRNGDATAETPRSSVVGWPAFFLTVMGGSMQGYANGTADAFFLAISFLAVGFFLVNFIFRGERPEMRGFLLAYGICVFVGGLAQCYSLATFGNPQSTTDAVNTFFPNIMASPPFTTIADMPINFNSRLAVVIWQQVYKLTWFLGLDFGPYIGVMFNAFVMGITGSITVRTARELFGDDSWRLRRVGTLFAACGLFILFGAVLIRDCFTTFLNAIVLWGIIHWMVRKTTKDLILAVALTLVSAYAMIFLRVMAVLIFGVFWVLVFLFWFFSRRLNDVRILCAGAILCVSLVAGTYMVNYVNMIQMAQTAGMEGYNNQSAAAYGNESLGMQFVVNQPFPIRMVLGSGVLMIFPMPLWIYFQLGSADYTWIKGYNGIYQVLVLPLVFAGFLLVWRMFKRGRGNAPLMYLAVYLLFNLTAVVATSMEQRHLAQFMPAFIILAALPDTREEGVRRDVHRITQWWLLLVAFVHLAWLFLKGVS